MFGRLLAIGTISFVLHTGSARASCTITDLGPTRTLPSRRADDGQRFIFTASDDCTTLEFSSGSFVATPSLGRTGTGSSSYVVELKPVVWKSLTEGRPKFTWTVTGWADDGTVTRVRSINDLDMDGDGWTRAEGDTGHCDQDGWVNPGRPETCDGLDQDCDGLIDEGVAVTWFRDADADGYGDPSNSIVGSCDAPSGYTNYWSFDCNDHDATVHPDATDVCSDRVDTDCDGSDCNVDLSSADATLWGEEFRDYAGRVAGAGDVNGDGGDDVLVGAYDRNDDAGTAYLVLGPISGDVNLSTADCKLEGSGTNYAGEAVAGPGDVNGDGFDDVLVGALDHAGTYTYAGAAFLVLGPMSGTLPLEDVSDAIFEGENAGDWTSVVAGAGDVNADGNADVLMSGSGNDGRVYLVLGPATATSDVTMADAKITSEVSGDGAGSDASGFGDMNGDGNDDLIIGAWQSDDGGEGSGAAYVVLGPVSGARTLATADAELIGDAGDYAGSRVSGAGDVNGDGTVDLLIGCPWSQPGYMTGVAYVVFGPVSGDRDLSLADAKVVGHMAYDEVGIDLAAAGDVDADGYDDLLIGSQTGELSDHKGGALLLFGPVSGAMMADVDFRGTFSGYAVGVSVAGAGDVDRDGLADLLVGSLEANAGWLIYGASL